MKLGISPDAIRPAAGLVELGRRTEALGFDSIWVPDHLAFFGSPVVDPFQALTAIAAGSSKLLLGTSVYVLPLRAPAQVAKQTASLDFVSGGRVALGVGVGGEFPGEYQASGVPMNERGKRMDESITVLRHLWAGSGEAFEGRFSSIPKGLELNPLPASGRGPEIWIGGRAEAAVNRAAAVGDAYLGFLFDGPAFMKRMNQVRERAAASGRDASKIVAGLVSFGFVGDDTAAAIDGVTRQLETNYGVPMRAAVERYGVVGDLESCAAKVRALKEIGVEHLVLASPVRGAEFDEQLEKLAKLRDRVG